MTKSKPWRRFLPILLAVLLALGIALYAVPYAQMVSYRTSAPVQTCAAQLAAAYGEKTGTALSQEDICRDLSYLQRWLMFSDTLPTEIVDLREGRPRYAMPITDTYTEYVDVTRSVTGNLRKQLGDEQRLTLREEWSRTLAERGAAGVDREMAFYVATFSSILVESTGAWLMDSGEAVHVEEHLRWVENCIPRPLYQAMNGGL